MLPPPGQQAPPSPPADTGSRPRRTAPRRRAWRRSWGEGWAGRAGGRSGRLWRGCGGSGGIGGLLGCRCTFLFSFVSSWVEFVGGGWFFLFVCGWVVSVVRVGDRLVLGDCVMVFVDVCRCLVQEVCSGPWAHTGELGAGETAGFKRPWGFQVEVSNGPRQRHCDVFSLCHNHCSDLVLCRLLRHIRSLDLVNTNTQVAALIRSHSPAHGYGQHHRNFSSQLLPCIALARYHK